MAFDTNTDYQALINDRKKLGFGDDDSQIKAWNASRTEKIASDPTKYLKYAQDPTAIYSTLSERAVNPGYDLQKAAEKQKFESLRQTAQNQLAALNPAYDQQIRRTQESYGKVKENVGNEVLNRGLGRSTYAVDRITDVGNEESQAIGDIEASRTADINGINANIAMYDQQLADSLASLDIDKAAKIAAKIDELRTYYDTQRTTQDQWNKSYELQKQGQDLQTKQFEENVRQFNVGQGNWQKTFTYNQMQDKIDNMYKSGQLSLDQRNTKIAEAKWLAENDEDSIDNKYKKALTAQTEAETKNMNAGLNKNGTPMDDNKTESQKRYEEEAKLSTVLDNMVVLDKKDKQTADSKAAQQKWIKDNKNNIITTFGKSYYDELAATYGIY